MSPKKAPGIDEISPRILKGLPRKGYVMLTVNTQQLHLRPPMRSIEKRLTLTIPIANPHTCTRVPDLGIRVVLGVLRARPCSGKSCLLQSKVDDKLNAQTQHTKSMSASSSNCRFPVSEGLLRDGLVTTPFRPRTES
jgi:hypothetical protein